MKVLQAECGFKFFSGSWERTNRLMTAPNNHIGATQQTNKVAVVIPSTRSKPSSGSQVPNATLNPAAKATAARNDKTIVRQ